ncbi:MAG TPA: hypothetical protein VN868_03925, partial [Terriglobales bacterium]|nr:hypothetical protein [Terriglobales bacterium]
KLFGLDCRPIRRSALYPTVLTAFMFLSFHETGTGLQNEARGIATTLSHSAAAATCPAPPHSHCSTAFRHPTIPPFRHSAIPY